MKKIVEYIFVVFLVFNAANLELFAQFQIAHVVSDSIIPKMAAYQTAMSELQTYSTILQKQFEGKEAEMEAYYMNIIDKKKKGLLAPKEEKEAELKLQEMEANLKKFGQDMERQLYEKEGLLMKPIYEEYNQAIKEVSKENNYTYIIDKKLTLYSAGGIDATSKISAKLKI
jgi:outer membrane protein